jgi:hypothetical protein
MLQARRRLSLETSAELMTRNTSAAAQPAGMLAAMNSLALAHAANPAFNADFFVAVTTVIPVLFIAAVVEQRFFRELVNAAVAATTIFGLVIGVGAAWLLARDIVLTPTGRRPEAGEGSAQTLTVRVIKWLLVPVFAWKVVKDFSQPTAGASSSAQTRPDAGHSTLAVSPDQPHELPKGFEEFAARVQRTASVTASTSRYVILLLVVAVMAYSTVSEIIAILALWYRNAAPWIGPFVAWGTIVLVIAITFSSVFRLLHGGFSAIQDDTNSTKTELKS